MDIWKNYLAWDRRKELLINNRETEIHLLILTTLHTLIDKYDKIINKHGMKYLNF